MKKTLKKLLSKIFVSVIALASIFSLSAILTGRTHDLSLKNVLETTEMAALGGGGNLLIVNP